MVPAGLYQTVRNAVGLDEMDAAGVWKSVASVVWKRAAIPTGTLGADENAKRALEMYEEEGGEAAYRSKQAQVKNMLDERDNIVNKQDVVDVVKTTDVAEVNKEEDTPEVETTTVTTRTCSWDYDALGYLQLSCE